MSLPESYRKFCVFDIADRIKCFDDFLQGCESVSEISTGGTFVENRLRGLKPMRQTLPISSFWAIVAVSQVHRLCRSTGLMQAQSLQNRLIS